MNKRIDELWGQALDKAVPETYSSLSLDQVEKVKQVFAELIVRECIEIAADQSAIRPEYRIRKHFGVEE